MQIIWNILRHWLPLAALTTALCALVYLAVQQALRQAVNDPQIQMAEDAAYALSQGEPANSVIPTSQVEMSRSLAPFIVMYDETGEAVASSGSLHGQIPSPPAGVFDFVKRNGEDRITWEPENGVRIAAIFERYEGSISGFLLVGRSLREIEKRESQVEMITGIAMLATWVLTFIILALCEFIIPSKR